MSTTRVPGHANVIVEVEPLNSPDGWRVLYLGFADDLIAAGVATAEMLAPSPLRGPAGIRLDGDGDHFTRHRTCVRREGVSGERFKVCRWKPAARALELPGAREAIAEYHRQKEAEAQRTEIRATLPDVIRSRSVGRFHRPIRWSSDGRVIRVDWNEVQRLVTLQRMQELQA